MLASAEILGQAVVLNGNPYTVIGVLPPEFHFEPAEPSEFWVTIHPANECDLRRSCHFLDGVGWLKDGASFTRRARRRHNSSRGRLEN